MPRLLVIADDLTGASDVGVQFARQGIPTLVLTEMLGLATLPSDYQVVIVNTESRHLTPDSAAQAVSTAVAKGIAAGATYFYKKTDSSLRGNIGCELEAFMRAASCRTLPFVPAFPKLKRTTRSGFHYVNEQRLHESGFANDPLEPALESFVPAIIARQTTLATKVLSILEVPGAFNLAGEAILVFDVLTDEDLLATGAALKANELLRVTAGSAGFAEFLPGLLGFERKLGIALYEKGRMLVVNGSVNEVSLGQVAHALAHGVAGLTLCPDLLLSADLELSDRGESLTAIADACAEGKDLIVNSIAKPEDVRAYLDLGRRQGRSGNETQQLMTRNLGMIAKELLAAADFKVLTVFGGDTLLGVARACGWSALLPQAEIAPGVVASRVSGALDAPLLITKAGGFGDTDVLGQIRSALGSY